MDWNDPAQVSTYNRAYRLAHHEELKTKNKASYIKNRGKRLSAQLAYRATRRKELSAKQRAYAKTHCEEHTAYRKAYYLSHRDESAEHGKRRRKSHQDELRTYNKAYYELNHDKLRAQARTYYATNRARHAEQARRYRKENPHVIQASHARRRASKKNAPLNDFTAQEWRDMQEHYAHRCLYCGKRCKGRLTQDHITPLSKGGSHTKHNIAPACSTCNSKKHTKPPPIPVQPLLL